MGVYKLSSYINEHCENGYFRSRINVMRNKAIIIDVIQFIYKYKQDGNLVEKIYLMCSLFRKYNITGIFILDGKSKDNKQQCLINRSNERARLLKKIKELELKQNKSNFDIEEISKLQNKTLQITKDDVMITKQIITHMGFQIVQCKNESDPILSYLSKDINIWGCMSEDSDMFVYGCKIVIKNLDLKDKSVIIYSLPKILKQLDLSYNEFKLLCLLSKNDYNQTSKYDFYVIHKLYKQYKLSNKSYKIPFYKCIHNSEQIPLRTLYSYYKDKKVFEKIHYKNNEINYNELKNILIPYGFYFIENLQLVAHQTLQSEDSCISED